MKITIEDYGTLLHAVDEAGGVLAKAEKITKGEHRRKWTVHHAGRAEILADKAAARRRLRELTGGAR